MADVKVGCTVEQVRLTLSTLANYHALSIMLLRKYKNPDGSYSLPEKLQYALKPVLFNESLPSMVSQKLPIVAEMIRHFNHEEVSDIFDKLFPRSSLRMSDDPGEARNIRLETKSDRILPLTYATKYDMT